ncbi:hypothetical protein A2V80_02775 [Candidatus Woesebacteria bacterium RBG_16_39_8b]|uniref:Uncharacterized protein n=1 Tax=Candidatus Woesebacteria bacterium RBG_16_39_8b TaxID=1802482 RepID=A0A1F7X9R7_9BACT|nr:MAG: hypothetical protein A2V80_02775 [Candidatus Woesebacteria bacterium RBG_16_39_8b]
MDNPENRFVLMRPDHTIIPDRRNILWQVLEVNYPSSLNCYEAADKLVFQINDLITNPLATPDDRWIFSGKDGASPSVRFMLFQNPQRVYGLVYDQAFFIRAMSIEDHIIALPIGHTSEVIYDRFYTAKLGSRAKVLKFPKLVIEGFLKQSADGLFELDSIFSNGWDCKQQYQAAHEISGFPTEAYDEIYFLGNYSAEYRLELINNILEKYKKWLIRHKLLDDTKPKLLTYSKE